MYVPANGACTSGSASSSTSTIASTIASSIATTITIKAISSNISISFSYIDINFNWVGVKQIRPNGREKQTNEGPWPENMANLVHGFLEIFLRKA